MNSLITYTFTTTSIKIVAMGIRNNPNQNTGDENKIWSIPKNTAATGKVGHKLLKQIILVNVTSFIAMTVFVYLYIRININHNIIEPHMEQCVNHVHEFVTSPALKHTVTTTYYNNKKQLLKRESGVEWYIPPISALNTIHWLDIITLKFISCSLTVYTMLPSSK